MEAIQGGIELTGTLYTSAQGEAKDKLAMAAQIYDQEQGKSQAQINKELKATAADTSTIDSKIAAAIKTNVTDKKGVANGLASLDASGKLPTAQLPTLKTINGNSIIGSGNISLDLSIYSVVTSLPATGANNKIYLVLTPGGGATGDLYTEYAWINNKWEEFGKYKAEVDLTPYMRKVDQKLLVKQLGILYSETNVELDIDYSKADGSDGESDTLGIASATTTKAGVMSKADKVKLDGIAAGANKYVLPLAKDDALGGVKVGEDTRDIDNSLYDTVDIFRTSDGSLYGSLGKYSDGEGICIEYGAGDKIINLTGASDTQLGGIRVGYRANGKNYPVSLDDNLQAYVNVPWSGGTNDAPIPTSELEAIFV